MGTILKQKGKQRIIAVVMAIAMVITSMQLGGRTAAAATGDSHTWSVTAATTLPSIIDGITLKRDSSFTENPTYSSTSLATSAWNEGGKYWDIEFSTLGWQEPSFGVSLRSSKTGPKFFKITSSIDNGNTWDKVTDVVLQNANLTKIDTVVLNSNTANQEKVQVRITAEMVGTVRNEMENVASAGISNINSIVIQDGEQQEKPPVIPPAATAADPITAEDVAAVTGGAITIDQAYAKVLDANEANNTVTLIGQIAYVYGSGGTLDTTVLQDIALTTENDKQIVGLPVYQFVAGDFNYSEGDVIALTGTLENRSGVIQLKDIAPDSVHKIAAKTAIPPQEITWSDIEAGKDNYLSEYVFFKNAKIGAAAITTSGAVKDSKNAAITFYSAAALPTAAKVGDAVEVRGVVSKYNINYQIRTGTTEKSFIGDFSANPSPSPSAAPSPEPADLYDPVKAEDVTSDITTLDQVKVTADKITVIGQIAYKYGSWGSINSTILQDVVDGKIYGLQVYSKMDGYEVGDVVTVTGTVAQYGKVLQLTSPEITKLRSDQEHIFAPQEVTLAELETNGENYISEYVKIKGVTLGAYGSEKAKANTSLTDVNGKKLNIYQSAKFPEGISEGDKVTALGIYSKYDTTYQLRNGGSNTSFLGDVIVDTSITVSVAKWAGTSKVESTPVYGDLKAENDRLDTTSRITLSSGKIPSYDYQETPVMGSSGLTNKQYYQLEFSTKKLGALKMNFDMRGSNTGAKYFKVLYSTDGVNFTKSDKISYTYSIYNYTSGETTTVTKENVDKLEVITNQVSYKVVLPKDISNEDKVYIRVQVTDDSTAIDTSKDPNKPIATGGVNRFMNVSLTGSPVVADNICGFVSADPASGTAALGQELTLSSATKDAEILYSFDNGLTYNTYRSDAKPVFNSFPVSVVAYASNAAIEPSIKITHNYTQEQAATPKISPNGGSVVAGTEVKISCETVGAELKYSLDGGTTWNNYTEKIKLETFPVTITAKAVKAGCLDSEIKTASFTQRTSSDYNVYFGQIHSHTSYSDGAGTCEDAFKYASTEAEEVDFLAVTDHSNSFDNDTSATIKDGSASTEWMEGHTLADKYTSSTFVGLYGYEMTWSGGAPGHMNTFNTEGFLSRNMDGYKNGSTTSLPNYYKQLKTVTDSISQFNHPGTTFGDFYDFGCYDKEIDQLVTTIEVGNGEGAVGSSGYFPSYEYYTRALDKGWHVAPTNNQDNHKGRWGDANTGRTVVLADSLTRENIYDALRNMRTYATEDNNLQIQYTLNNAVMGSIFEEKPDEVNIKVKLEDADNEALGKVEVIVNGGMSIANKTIESNKEEVTFDLPASYSYYYIRVTQKDGNIAVTAPVWISEVEAVGISSISTTASLPVKNEELPITTTLYNNENDDFLVESIVFKVGDKVIKNVDLTKETQMQKVAFGETPSYTFSYKHDSLGKTDIEVLVSGTLKGTKKLFTDKLQLNYVDPSMITRVIVDGTHNNDYVTGYYGGNVGNFADIAAGDKVQVSVEKTKITKEMLEDCKLLVISAPAKKKGQFNSVDYGVSHFEDSFIQMVGEYVKAGGNVILCGLADYQDSNDCQSTTEINKLLEAMGATTRLNGDEVVDDTENSGEKYRLYFTKFNQKSKYMQGITTNETCSSYSAYSGCSVIVDPNAEAAGKAEALVYGHDTTYSFNSKATTPEYYVEQEKGKIVTLAHETVGDQGGEVFVGGTVFISNFEVKADLDYAGELTYANRLILLNILGENKKRIDATDISKVRKAKEGEPFAIEGYVTAGTAVEGNTFFDTIYVQDDTAGITVFPIADAGIKVGQKIRVEGFVDGYQGDKELQAISYELLDGNKVYNPKEVSAKDAMDYELNGGNLVKVKGKITKIDIAAGDLKYIYVQDESGTEAMVFTDGYILDSNGYTGLINDLKVGSYVSAVGLVYMNPDGVCLRVRNRAEIKIEEDSNNQGEPPYVSVPSVTPEKPSTDNMVVKDTFKTEITAKAVNATEGKDGIFYTKDGKKVTDAIVKSASGERYIVDETGNKYVSAMVVTKTGIMYLLDDQGIVFTGSIVETENAKYYTTKGTGKVVANKLIKINGKKYFAAKSGKLVTSKWVTVGVKKYYCNAEGIITRTK